MASKLSEEIWNQLEDIYSEKGMPGCRTFLEALGFEDLVAPSTVRNHMSDRGIKAPAVETLQLDSDTIANATKKVKEPKVEVAVEDIPNEEIAATVFHDLQVARLNREIKILRRKYEEAITTASFDSQVIDLLKTYRQQMVVPKVKDRNVESPKLVKTKETIGLILTDWHVGEVVSAEAMHGVNRYDVDTFLARAERTVDTALDVLFGKMTGYQFDDIRLYVNGDLINGMFGAMHDELIITQQSDLMETVYGTAGVLVQIIATLLQFFKTVHVNVAPGNHGRMQKKPMAKMANQNWDVMVPQIASTFFYNEPRVFWNMPDSFFYVDEVEGQRILGLHGHQIKGWASIPWYGINRTVGNLTEMIDNQRSREIENKVRSGAEVDLNELKNMRVNHVLLGHFHQEAIFDRGIDGEVIAGPCLKGSDEYSLSAGFKPSSAGQTMFGIHENHGITHRWRLNSQDAYEPKGDLEWFRGGTLSQTWSEIRSKSF